RLVLVHQRLQQMAQAVDVDGFIGRFICTIRGRSIEHRVQRRWKVLQRLRGGQVAPQIANARWEPLCRPTHAPDGMPRHRQAGAERRANIAATGYENVRHSLSVLVPQYFDNHGMIKAASRPKPTLPITDRHTSYCGKETGIRRES